MSGALLVAGTASDAGKTVVVAGLCRWLARRGVKVAPFKAQNMALNAAVTADGAEIGRAQAMQAAAAGVDPVAAMNPVLLKPSSDRRTQVVVLGRAAGAEDAASYQQRKAVLLEVAAGALADLRARYDVVICEGAGSPAEINLRAHDLANMGLARRAGLPTLVVGDIDRGGVLAGLYGTLALLGPADQALVAGFLVNKFRGDPDVLRPGLDALAERTGRPTLGVLPWVEGLALDAEDSLALARPREAGPPRGPDGLDVAVVHLPRISNFTDLDPLAAEPGVSVRVTAAAGDLARADLVVVPGTKATVADLAWLRARGLDAALRARARAGGPILGICGGYQLLGEEISDTVESGAGTVPGLGLLPVRTTFAPDKVLARRRGTSTLFGGTHAATGYEIRHGRVRVHVHADVPGHAGAPLLRRDDGQDEGCVVGAVLGTSWHGLLEADGLRRALLGWVAERRARVFVPGDRPFAAVREAFLDTLGDLVEQHADTGALQRLLDEGVPAGLPTLHVSPGPAAPDPAAPTPTTAGPVSGGVP